ncbi:glycosyl hydrolase [bacterium]|nr:glycosyl hydrolase [bacterium]
MTPARSGGRSAAKKPVTLLIGTMKGAFILKSDAARKQWRMQKPQFFGHEVNHLLVDPRNRRTWMLAGQTGHLGPTVQRSLDGGKSWQPAAKPPAFSKKSGKSVQRVFFLAPGHTDEPGTWYAGTVPFGLFRSEDNGEIWKQIKGFDPAVIAPKWGMPSPVGEITHSVIVDPRNRRHLYVSMSCAGFYESRDRGKSWKPVNSGQENDFFPPSKEERDHGYDPHCTVQSAADPDRFYQQNHCGIYVMDLPESKWRRVGRNMPEAIGDVGFPIVAHPRKKDVAWVFPMDAMDVWPRTSPDGKPAVFRTTNAGKTWQRQAKGLPAKNAWFTVLRQAMKADGGNPVGIYFGTTQGEVWGSTNEGASWRCLASYMPRILSIEVAP